MKRSVTSPIVTEEQHEAAIAELSELWAAKSGSPEGDRLDQLATLIDAYEVERYPMDLPSSADAIRFRADQQGA